MISVFIQSQQRSALVVVARMVAHPWLLNPKTIEKKNFKKFPLEYTATEKRSTRNAELITFKNIFLLFTGH